jgi:Uma2 family endonuclease
MGMPAQHTEWTAAMARALPDDGKRYEVLDGELVVTPAPSWDHQSVVEELLRRLSEYVSRHQIGWLKISPADIELSPRRLVQPDLFVVPWGDGRRPRRWKDITALLLVIEVTSPSTARTDRQEKRRIFQDAGIPQYWIVDPDARVVERWQPADVRPEVLAESLSWQPKPPAPAFEMDLPSFFSSLLD